MNQDAFRALLSVPSAASSSRRPAQTSKTGGRVALAGSKSRAETGRTSSDQKPTGSLKPRKFKPKNVDGTQKKAKESEGGYRDRASERRQGKDGDFAEAESLLQDFQARFAAAGDQVDRDLLEQQTKYLGGDERHTILVKGLDHALLERRKAELSMSGKLGQVTDDDLEAAFEETQRREGSHVSNQPAEAKAHSPSRNSIHRDELLAQLKSSRSNASKSVLADLAVVDKLKKAGKFKPIGSADKASADNEEKERKERKKRKKEKKSLKVAKLGEAGASGQPKKSKDKVSPSQPKPSPDTHLSNVSIAQSDLASSSHDRSLPLATVETDSQPGPSKSFVSEKLNPASPVQPGTLNEQPFSTQTHPVEDEIDIFGEVGDYKPFGDNSDETDEEGSQLSLPPSQPPGAVTSSMSTFKRKNYFEDDPDPSDEDRRSQGAIASASGPAPNRTRQTAVVTEPEDEEPGRDDADQSGLQKMRLEGLSGSADIRSLLAADAAQEKEEKRRAKKLKKSETVKVLTEKDKLNRDVMEMDRYLKKKNVAESSTLQPDS